MAELTEDRVREIVKEEIATAIPVHFTLDIDGESVAKTVVAEIQKRTGKGI